MSNFESVQKTAGLNKDHQDHYKQAVYKGGVQGAGLAAALAIPAHFILRRKANYNNIPITLRALGYVCLIVPCISITAEKAGEAYIRSTWSGTGKVELDREAQRAAARWESLDNVQKAKDWGSRHKWGLIGAAWAGSMGISFALVARSPQTFSQKLVQARMWAQGLTVGTLIGSAVLSGVSTTDNKIVQGKADHSWADILEQEGLIKKSESDKIRGSDK